jgi:hypothetical protein
MKLSFTPKAVSTSGRNIITCTGNKAEYTKTFQNRKLLLGGIIVKKFLSVILAIGLCLGLAVTAGADETATTFIDADGVVHEISFLPPGFNGGVAQLSTTEGRIYVNKSGKTVASSGLYDSFSSFSEGLAPVAKDEKYGYIDTTGAVVIPYEYDTASPFSEGLAIVSKDGSYAHIDKKGATVIDLGTEYDYAESFSEDLACVWKELKAGYIDKTGKLAIPLQYSGANSFNEGFAIVTGENGKYGFIDKTGAFVVPAEYDGRPTVMDGVAVVTEDGKDIYIDLTNKVTFSVEYERASLFVDGMARVYNDGKWGYMDKTGALAIPLEYESAADFNDGMAQVTKDGKWGYIDKSGKLVIPAEYTTADWFQEGLAGVSKDNKSGYIDKSGAVAIQFEYDSGGSFSEGLAGVRKDGKYGYIDKTGKVAIPLIYSSGYSFSEGMAWVYVDRSMLLIDKNGTVVAGNGATAPVPPASATAKPTSSPVLVNGKQTSFDAYNIADNNYFKLRDLAYVLSGTEKQFEVGYDDATKAITLTSGESYTAVGGEMEGKGAESKTANPTSSKIYLDGAEISITAYNIGGNNYFKLRDIGETFDFEVDWDGENRTIVIDTSKSYTPD